MKAEPWPPHIVELLQRFGVAQKLFEPPPDFYLYNDRHHNEAALREEEAKRHAVEDARIDSVLPANSFLHLTLAALDRTSPYLSYNERRLDDAGNVIVGGGIAPLAIKPTEDGGVEVSSISGECSLITLKPFKLSANPSTAERVAAYRNIGQFNKEREAEFLGCERPETQNHPHGQEHKGGVG